MGSKLGGLTTFVQPVSQVIAGVTPPLKDDTVLEPLKPVESVKAPSMGRAEKNPKAGADDKIRLHAVGGAEARRPSTVLGGCEIPDVQLGSKGVGAGKAARPRIGSGRVHRRNLFCESYCRGLDIPAQPEVDAEILLARHWSSA